MVRRCKTKDAADGDAGSAEEVADAHEERARVGGHVLDVGREEVVAEKGVFGVSRDGFDEELLVFG